MKRVLVFLLLFQGYCVSAQILDDSTQLVYGPTTTKYLYESNIKYNDLYFTPVDTAIFNLHRFTTTEVSNYLLQVHFLPGENMHDQVDHITDFVVK